MDDKFDFFIGSFDLFLSQGILPEAALKETAETYAYVYHNIERETVDAKDLENRFTYHPPKPGQPAKYEWIRECAKQLAKVIDNIAPDSREKSLAITAIEEAVSWANAAIARHE